MKKLKCESCGGNIEIEDENQEYATCPYCKTKYKLNERKDIIIKMDDNTKEILTNTFGVINKRSKLVLLFPMIIFIVVTAIIISTTTSSQNSYDKTRFNQDYENYQGTQSKFFISSLLDNAVTNNKTNKDIKITIIYTNIKTTDPDKIIEIKHSLVDNKKYEIKLDYDKNGYVNIITIEDI